MDVILTAAVTANGMIARHSHEFVDWSRDLALFKEQTMGYPVIMGSNTAETLAADLKGREMIVVHRHDDPKKVLEKLDAAKCFIIGGSRTYGRFARLATHAYLTYHPQVFPGGLPLFTGLINNVELELEKKIEVRGQEKIYQFQYKIEKP